MMSPFGIRIRQNKLFLLFSSVHKKLSYRRGTARCVVSFEILPIATQHDTIRGVVVRERGGTPFRQLFWSRNGAPANIVGHRWNANTEAFRQITSYSLG